MKKIIFLLLLLISFVYAKNLLLVTLESPPPFFLNYANNNKPMGININIASEALRRLGHNVQIKFYPWKRALRIVEYREADGIIDVAYNSERAECMHYPNHEIYTANWCCFQNKDSNLTLDKDFKNAKEIKLGIGRAVEHGGLIQQTINNNMFKYIDVGHNNMANIKN